MLIHFSTNWNLGDVTNLNPTPTPHPFDRKSDVTKGHIIRNWKNRFFVLQMANEGSRKVFRLLYYKEQANYEDTPPTGAVTIAGARTSVNDAPAGL